MAAILIVLAAVVVGLGYRFYASRIDREVIQSDPKRATPATMYKDGVDFMPAKASVLFGYQFKSIAALGPILGPVIAAQWGWLPGLLWLILGVFFIGWVQDYTSAIVAMRNDGMTMGGLSYKLISPRARTLMLIFLYWYLLLIMAGFGATVAALVGNPVVPSGVILLTIIGVVAGQAIYRWRRDLLTTTVIAVILAFVGVWLGTVSPLKDIWAGFYTLVGTKNQAGAYVMYQTPYGPMVWGTFFGAIVVMLFSYLGSVLPIWRYAQPINYVSFWLVGIGIVLAIVGVLIGQPSMGDFPAYRGFSVSGPGLAGTGVKMLTPLWPFLFVTISCGAISGWHSLVSTSGTARQLEKETDALPVGGGAMYSEAVLGVLSLVAATAGFGGLQPYLDKMAAGGPAATWVGGFAKFLGSVGVPATFATAFGSVFLVVMALTILQLVLRFLRVASTELLGDSLPAFKNPHVGSIVAIVLALIIMWSGFWPLIWVLFGASNQMFAALALILITLYLMGQRRSYGWSLYPAIFMFLTTLAALWGTAFYSFVAAFNPASAAAAQPAFVLGNIIAGLIGAFLGIAALVFGLEALGAFNRSREAAPAGPAVGK